MLGAPERDAALRGGGVSPELRSGSSARRCRRPGRPPRGPQRRPSPGRPPLSRRDPAGAAALPLPGGAGRRRAARRDERGAGPLAGAGLPAPARPPEVAVAAAGAGGGRGGRGGHPLLHQQGQPAGVERRAVHGERPREAVGEGAASEPAVQRAAALVRLPGKNGDRRAAGSDFLRSGYGLARCGPKKRRSLGRAAGEVRAGARRHSPG